MLRPRALVFFFSALLILAAWFPNPAPAQEKIEIVDLAGRKVSVPAGPNRIVCLGPGALRLIVYLQAQDKVVGVEAMEKQRPDGRPYIMAQRQLLKLPAVSPGGPSAINKKPDLEGLLKAAPEVIFATQFEAGLADQVQALLGRPVVVLSYGRFGAFDEVIYDSLRLAGKILGRAGRAEAVVRFIEAARQDLGKRVEGLEDSRKPSVYVGGMGFRGSHGLESTDALYIPFAWLRARNVVAGRSAKGHFFLDKEELLGLQPEFVFLDGGGLTLMAADYAKKPDFYKALKAFQAGKVYALHPFNWYTTNVGTTLGDAFSIGRIIHPDRFGDVEVTKKADEIYSFLIGAPVYAGMAGIYGPLGGRPEFLK